MVATGRGLVALALPLIFGAAACEDDDGAAWEIVHEELPGALFSVWGASARDVWAVGSDPGDGPMVLHFDGDSWRELDAGTAGDLWWVFGFPGGTVYMGGAGGTILAYRDGEFTSMETPGAGVTVFGIWGCSPDDVWAVGGEEGGQRGGFAWRLDGDAWVPADGFSAEVDDADAVWKIFGRSCDDVWMVGTAGLAIHWDGESFGGVERVAGGSLFTVHANADRFVAVGGFGTGLVVENAGSGWTDASPAGVDPAVGVCLTGDGGYVSGWYGSILRRGEAAWEPEDTGFLLDETFHAVWVDPDGGAWAAGGQVLAPPFGRGVMIHKPN